MTVIIRHIKTSRLRYSLNCFNRLLSNNSKDYAEMARHVIEAHTAPIPTILEIPSKESPYDPTKDSILKRAKDMFGGDA